MAPALDPFYTSQAAQAAPRVTTRKVIRRTTRVPVWTRSDQGLPCEQDQVDGRVGHPVQRACKVMNAELARGTAIQRVWQSGRDEAALAYRRRMGMADDPRIGVVVQRLVAPDVAGVLFTRDPVSGTPDR